MLGRTWLYDLDVKSLGRQTLGTYYKKKVVLIPSPPKNPSTFFKRLVTDKKDKNPFTLCI